MLPDFPDTKKVVRDAHFRIFFRAMNEARGIFSDIPIRPVREGNQTAMVRPGGIRDDTKMHKLRVMETVPHNAAETWTDAQVIQHYETLGKQMGEQQARASYQEIDKVTEQTGNVIDANGPLTPEIFFAAIEKIWIEFGDDGKPRLPTIVSHPHQAKAWKKLSDDMEADPKNTKRMDELLARKKMEWREREASRRLVE